MKRLALLPILVLLVAFAGCSTAKFSSTQHLGVTLNLTTNDVVIEKRVVFSLPYDKDDADLKSTVYEAARVATGYDLILMPSYEIIVSSSPFVKDTITIKGYGAKLKGVQALPKAEIKPEPKAEVKPEIIQDVKPETKTEVKPDVKPEAKLDTKPEVKP